MIELVATATITVSSALLFAYWFRYTCLLILSTKAARDYTSAVAMANELQVLQVQAALPTAMRADLERLHQSLERDYKVLSYLFRSAAGASGERDLEDRMLALYYRVMEIGYGASRGISESFARKALEEMSQVVAHFANALGERGLAASAAA
jgi:hypothetical protein